MWNKNVPESRILPIAGLLVLAAFVALGVAEYRIIHGTDPARFHISFPDAEGAALSTELCQDGPTRDFAVSASVESEREPYFETSVVVGTHDCTTIDIPAPETLPDERPARVRVRAEDPDSRTLELFRMLP